VHELVIIDCRFRTAASAVPITKRSPGKSTENQQQEKKPGSQSPA
jgi:hypothetical protein